MRTDTSGITGPLPRLHSPALLQVGGCIPFRYGDLLVHTPNYAYVVRGSERVLLVDTGNPADWERILPAVEAFLEGRNVDYVFPSHPEVQHTGLLARWLDRYPEAEAVGDVRNLHLAFPDIPRDRLRRMRAGDSLDLGDRRFEFLPAVWHDLPNTLWGFDTADRVMFCADAFGWMHGHAAGMCGMTAAEKAPIEDVLLTMYYDLSYYTRWVEPTLDRAQALFDILEPRLVASTHGGVVDCLPEWLAVNREQLEERARAASGANGPAL